MTIYTSNTETYFEKNPKTGKTWKSTEWELVSDGEMIYTKYNEDGTINRRSRHTGAEMGDLWSKYHTKH